MTKVSIIVPVWNVFKYLDNCLNSLVNQTLKDIEIIVINDGSPDNSQQIIDKYAKKYKNIVSIIKENGGQGSARNMGLDIAKGEYIGFVDSDDYVDESMYEKLYNKAIEKKYDIVICNFLNHYPNGTTELICCGESKLDLFGSACNKLFKKSFIGTLRYLPKIWYEDLNFTMKLLAKTDNYAILNEGLYHYIIHESSTMNNNNSKKNLDIITCIDNIKDYLKENNITSADVIYKDLVYNAILIDAITRVAMHKNKEKKQVIKNLTLYCRNNLKNYKKTFEYKNSPNNRKIIAWFNYNNLSSISNILLSVKQKIKRS